MENLNDIYTKAGVLMQGALKKYSEGDFEAADKERKQANELYDLAEKYANMEAGKDVMLYGEGKNFGIIYSIIEANTPKWFLNKKYNKALKELTETILKNNVLKTQFDVYNAFRSINENVDNEKYVNEVLNSASVFSKKQLSENNQILIDLIRKYNGNELVEIDDNKAKLYEAIEYLLIHNPKISNIGECLYRKNLICEYLSEHIEKTKDSIDDIDNILHKGINEMVSTFQEELNDNEQKLMEDIATYGNGDINEAFNRIKEEVSSKLQKMVNESHDETRDRLSNILSSINEMKYDKDNIEDFVKLHEIKNRLLA